MTCILRIHGSKPYIFRWSLVYNTSIFCFSHFHLEGVGGWSEPNETIFIWKKLSHFATIPKHNDELFNIYYRIFYELSTFANFDRLCKLEKRGDEIKKNLLLWNYWANLNQTLLKWFLGGPLPKLCPVFQNSDQDGHHSRT
jgi:hypothetical protein